MTSVQHGAKQVTHNTEQQVMWTYLKELHEEEPEHSNRETGVHGVVVDVPCEEEANA